MVITFVGWFGTETIGDRAILAGIFHILSLSSEDDIVVRLGSLYTPLTERTLLEDGDFYREISFQKVKSIVVFNSLSIHELNNNIKGSDILFVSGGPLGDMDVMYMIKYAFNRAKNYGIKTALFGNGWGPLKKKEFISLSIDLVEKADCVIFRDETSVQEYIKHSGTNTVDSKIRGLIDPAFFAAQFFRSGYDSTQNDSNLISINFRELFVTEKKCVGRFCVDDCIHILESALSYNPDKRILLVPMHTFVQGGDDRRLENELASIIRSSRLTVQNNPLSLEETMSVYAQSDFCVGMRYHAILLQTVLNGKNYILDYTDYKSGKTGNLLRQLNLIDEYNDRYVSCENIVGLEIKSDIEKVNVSDSLIESYKEQYIIHTKKLLFD